MYLTGAKSSGFALPTVVIATVVMFMILVAAVGNVSSARVALDNQYYQAQLRDAAESGAARASDCIGNSTMVVNAIVTPATNCDGTAVTPARSAYVMQYPAAPANPVYRTSYEIKLVSSTTQSKQVQITGKIDTLRASDGSVVKSSTLPLRQNAVMVLDPAGDRPSQRYWYFGQRAIMDFGVSGSAMPTFTYNSAATTPAPLGYEGTTTVSDQNGNLVFWTNGLTIWDKTGNIMQNSTGLNGANSATQAVASFPMNTSRTKYGVVSNSGQGETGFGELYFSIVDTTQNSGNGAVTEKNTILGTRTATSGPTSCSPATPPAGCLNYSSEALNAMPNADGTGYYVYTFNPTSAKVISYLIKNTGAISGPNYTPMSPTPLICNTIASGSTGYSSINFSQDYTKMILMSGAFSCNGSNGGGANDSGRAYLYNVNTATGALTLAASWITSGWIGTAGGSHSGYTADFSPQEKYIYVGQIYPGNIIRYDIQTLDSTAIKNSEWVVSFDTTDTDTVHIRESGAHIRQGPDGRMWIADRAVSYYPIAYQSAPATTPCKMSYISAPDSPINSKASIGLQLDAITLPSGACSIWGLPQVATVFKPKVLMY